MNFKDDWRRIGDFEQDLEQSLIDEVNEILFAPDPPQHALDAINICLVLGSRNCGYKAVRAAELFGTKPDVSFVACGANLSVHGPVEADLIRDTLIERGVSAHRIILERQSTNTGGNLRHAAQLIAEHLGDPRDRSIAIISSGFHRLHVLASLPVELSHAIYVSASGPTASRSTWHSNAQGRAVVLHELLRPGFTGRRDSRR